MIVIAVVAVFFGLHPYLIELKKKRASYLARAVVHTRREAEGRQRLAWLVKIKPLPLPRSVTQEQAPSMRRDDLGQKIGMMMGAPVTASREVERVIYRKDQEERTQALEDHRRRRIAESKGQAVDSRPRNVGDYRQNELKYTNNLIDYHAALARKYQRAARYPWFAVEPDPPEPEW